MSIAVPITLLTLPNSSAVTLCCVHFTHSLSFLNILILSPCSIFIFSLLSWSRSSFSYSFPALHISVFQLFNHLRRFFNKWFCFLPSFSSTITSLYIFFFVLPSSLFANPKIPNQGKYHCHYPLLLSWQSSTIMMMVGVFGAAFHFVQSILSMSQSCHVMSRRRQEALPQCLSRNYWCGSNQSVVFSLRHIGFSSSVREAVYTHHATNNNIFIITISASQFCWPCNVLNIIVNVFIRFILSVLFTTTCLTSSFSHHIGWYVMSSAVLNTNTPHHFPVTVTVTYDTVTATPRHRYIMHSSPLCHRNFLSYPVPLWFSSSSSSCCFPPFARLLHHCIPLLLILFPFTCEKNTRLSLAPDAFPAWFRRHLLFDRWTPIAVVLV